MAQAATQLPVNAHAESTAMLNYFVVFIKWCLRAEDSNITLRQCATMVLRRSQSLSAPAGAVLFGMCVFVGACARDKSPRAFNADESSADVRLTRDTQAAETAPASQAGIRVEIVWQGIQPEVDTLRPIPRVQLPLEIRRAIMTRFAGYRVPDSQDYQLDWLQTDLAGKVPFATIGDFNHDGRRDVALRIKSEKRIDHWKLVIFHAPDFRPVVLEVSPDPAHDMRDYGAIQRYGLAITNDCNKAPCLISVAFEASASLFEWTGNGYAERAIMD